MHIIGAPKFKMGHVASTMPFQWLFVVCSVDLRHQGSKVPGLLYSVVCVILSHFRTIPDCGRQTQDHSI